MFPSYLFWSFTSAQLSLFQPMCEYHWFPYRVCSPFCSSLTTSIGISYWVFIGKWCRFSSFPTDLPWHQYPLDCWATFLSPPLPFLPLLPWSVDSIMRFFSWIDSFLLRIFVSLPQTCYWGLQFHSSGWGSFNPIAIANELFLHLDFWFIVEAIASLGLLQIWSFPVD